MLAVLLFSTSLAAASPAALIDRLFAAFNRHDVLALQALYAPDARLTSSDFCSPRRETDVTRTYGALFRSFPDIHDRVDTVVLSEDRAAVRFTSTSNVHERAFRLKLVTFFRFRDGKIVEDDTIFNTKGRKCEE